VTGAAAGGGAAGTGGIVTCRSGVVPILVPHFVQNSLDTDAPQFVQNAIVPSFYGALRVVRSGCRDILVQERLPARGYLKHISLRFSVAVS
jgi:hypothetical protein